MRKRELLFGFGAGLIVATSIVGLTHPKQQPVPASLSREQMKEAADALQMVVLSQEEYDQWQQEKKVHLKPASAANQPKSPQVDPAKPPVAPATKQTSPSEQPQSPGNTVAPAGVQKPRAPIVSFTVPYKATAEGVAHTLVEAGILPAENTLVDDLRSQDKLDRIRVGTYQISASATVADIVELLTTPPKK